MSEPMPAPTNPLAEASPASLDEFFSRNPWEMTDGEFLKMIHEFRRQRVAWLAAEAAGAKRAPVAKKSRVANASTLKDLGLED